MRRIIQISARFLLGLGLLLGLVDVVARLVIDEAYYVWPPRLEQVSTPNLPGVSGESRFTTNEIGMRADPLTTEQQYHALVVGGSTTTCGYLDDTEAWPHVVQDDLDAVLGAGTSWVGNVGRAGHTTAQHTLQVEKLLAQHPEIDTVILLVGSGDLLIHLAFARLAERGESLKMNFSRQAALDQAFSLHPGAELEAPWYRRTGIARLWRRSCWGSLRASDREPDMDTNGKLVFEARKHRREASAFLEKLPDFDSALAGYAKRISEIAEVARRRGVRPVFLTQPSLWRGDLSQEERDLLWMGGPPFDRLEEGGYYSVDSLAEGMAGYNETLLRVCREQELDCLDTASSLPRDTRIFWDDLHVTEEGARVLAKLVAEFLLTREPLATMRERAAGTR